MSMRFMQTDMTTNYSNIYILSLPTIHMKCTMRYGGVVVGGNGHCPQVWTMIHSHVLKTEHCIMPGGWEGGSMTAL